MSNKQQLRRAESLQSQEKLELKSKKSETKKTLPLNESTINFP